MITAATKVQKTKGSEGKLETEKIWRDRAQTRGYTERRGGVGAWISAYVSPSFLPEPHLLTVLHLHVTLTLNFCKLASGAGETAQG